VAPRHPPSACAHVRRFDLNGHEFSRAASVIAENLNLGIDPNREQLGVSQEAFADRIQMHRNYYGAIERGEKTMRLDTLERVAAGLEVEAWRLLREATD
jgi:ribosome-binding protein aMBF1 (putative translation factor)